ncbi:MAG: M23 family metallopeptidase [Ferruginibacter sp.]
MEKDNKKKKRFRNRLIFLVFFLSCIYLFFTWSTPVTGNIDEYVYDLPFESGQSFRVVQGYGGLFSHKNTAAIDFAMPVGTPVLAARGGTIYAYKDEFEEGGPLPGYRNKANFIMIRHDDGSYGCYWHLKKNGVLVKSGRVEKGQLIGLSGATGFVLRPHLHFSVKRKLDYEMNSFVQTKFNTSEGITILKVTRFYRK